MLRSAKTNLPISYMIYHTSYIIYHCFHLAMTTVFESRIWIKWTSYIVATPKSHISVNRGRRYRLVCWVDRSLWADAVIIHICHRLHNVVFLFNTFFFTFFNNAHQHYALILENVWITNNHS